MIHTNYSRLTMKIVIVIVGFSMIPLMSLGWILFHQFNAAYEEKAASNLVIMVDNKQRAIDLFLKQKIAFLRTLADSFSFEDFSSKGAIQSLFKTVKSFSNDFVDLGIIDKEGNHVAYDGPYKISNVNFKDETWFLKVQMQGIYVSDVFMGFRQFPHFIIAVLRQEGDSLWIMRATVNLEVFLELVQTVQTGKKGDAFLVNKKNVLQTPSRFNDTVLSKSGLKELPSHFNGVMVERGKLDGQNRLLGMSWLKSVNWLLVISEDSREEMSQMIRSEHNAFMVFMAGTLMVCIGAVFVTRSMVKKIMTADKEAAMLNASLLQSNKMAALGKLAAGVAHEVNNPLTLIRESAGWVKDLLSEEDPQKMTNYEDINETLDKIDRHVERAKGVTQRMLGFGRRMDPLQEDVSINSVLSETLTFLESEALHQNIAIEKQLAPDLPSITSDPNQIQQVFLNVLENAIDAITTNGGNEGTITLRTGSTPEGKEIFAAISDTGGGMPPELQQKIFDPFYTTKAVGEGTGLGLSITYGILEKIGGRITADSEMGKGSTLTVYFPLR